MTDHSEPPTLSQAFAAVDQTQPSTWLSRQSENSKPKPSAKTRGLIGRLGLRYHPANAADLQSHQAMLSLLADDLATIPTDLLEKAIDAHVLQSPFMPKAADLIRLAQGFVQAPKIHRTGRSYAHDLADVYNSRRTRTDVEWYVSDAGEIKIGHVRSEGCGG